MTARFDLGDYLLNERSSPDAQLILAHGAGAPMDSEFMEKYACSLAERGVRVIRFEFPYMAQRRHGGCKRPPNPQRELLKAWQAAIECHWQPNLPCYIGGKSMGGRMASMLPAQKDKKIAGIICLGYPFHPVGKPQKTRVAHLQSLAARCLIIQGDRDRFGRPEEVENYDLSANIELRWLKTADHDFKPLKSHGESQNHCIDLAAQWSRQFIAASIA